MCVIFKMADYQNIRRVNEVSARVNTDLFSIATREERRAVNERKARKLFQAAEIINDLGADGKLKAIRMMVDLCAGDNANKAPKAQDLAATWLWQVCHLEVQHEDGTPMSAGRRASARRRGE